MQKNKRKLESGITLIALVLTIIVLLILAGVTFISLTGDNNVLKNSVTASEQNKLKQSEEEVKIALSAVIIEKNKTQMTDEQIVEKIEKILKQIYSEQKIGTTVNLEEETITINHRGSRFTVDKETLTFVISNEVKNEWDKTAADEDCFYWASDVEGEEGYGTIVGYTSKIENYTLLRYPTRCTKIEFTVSTTLVDRIEARSFTNNIQKVEIPGTVKEIAYSAFGINWSTPISFASLKEVVIEEGLTTIGAQAFMNCTELESITIPSTVTSIGGSAFYKCSKLSNIEIPGNLTTIGNQAFDGCKGIESIIIPSTTTDIGYNAFSGWTSSQTIYFEVSEAQSTWNAAWQQGCSARIVYNYKEGNVDEDWDLTAADESCYVWTSSVEGEDGYGTIEGYTSALQNYTLVRFPTRCTKISFKYQSGNELLMRSYTNNILKVEIPGTVKEIASSAFGCPWGEPASFTDLKIVEIEEGLEKIGRSAFFYCNKLESITLPSTLTSIDDSAFAHCTSLESIVIPSSVTSLGSAVFQNWTSNQTIYFEASAELDTWEDGWRSSCNANVEFGYKGTN